MATDHGWLRRCEGQLRAAGAHPEAITGGTHRKWRFQDGYFVNMPAVAHGQQGHKVRNTEAAVRRAIAQHGVARARQKSPGMKPSEVDQWEPLGPSTHTLTTERAMETDDAHDVATEEVLSMPTTDEAAPPRGRHTCNYCQATFQSHAERQSHYLREHAKTWTCPVCQKTMKQRGRHNHDVKGGKTARMAAAAAPAPEAPPPSLREAPHTALRTALTAVQSVQGYIAKLEEENKLLYAELAAAHKRLKVIEELFLPQAAKPPRR